MFSRRLILNPIKLCATFLGCALLVGCAPDSSPKSGRLDSDSKTNVEVAGGESAELESQSAAAPSELSAQELYSVHCMTCHGETGNADGPGSKSVYPLPRNFRTDQFKSITHENLRPTIEDFVRVIAEGMPGTSMVAFNKLHTDDHLRLANEVMRLWLNGNRDRIIAEAAADGEELDEKTIAEIVEEQTIAKRKVEVPVFPDSTAESVARGSELYIAKSCQSCHAEDGRGSKTVDLVDEHGQWIRPRDLVNEPYKCGNDRKSVFLQLKLGIPGTPHPSNMSLTDEELIDLCNFIESIRAEKKVLLTGHQRRSSISVRDYLRQLDQFAREP